MAVVQAGALAKIKDLLPDQIGANRTRSDEFVQNLIMLAMRQLWSMVPMLYGEQTISMVANQHGYTLDSEFVRIKRVRYADDGSDFQYHLAPATLDDFDRASRSWRTIRGIRPDLYYLLSTPGVPTASIYVYPAVASPGGAAIKVIGQRIGTTTSVVNDDVLDKFVVPYVLSLLYSTRDTRLARRFMDEARDGASELRSRFADELPTGQDRDFDGGWTK